LDLAEAELELPSSQVPIFISAKGPDAVNDGGDPPLPSRRLLPPNILQKYFIG
jgi:hypothetical protein